ncbi:MAG TPA: hypothetical protein VFD06_06680, partial [Candidatus Polarisedimenticolia bacterium]|nr:hypothetical protein [Candidatus Polarisedimenticolia bacterium]
SIYPLLMRLRSLGLVQERPHAEGRRKSVFLSLTAEGRAALAQWILPPLPDVVVGVPSDPLRTRLGFLVVLSPAQRRRFLADAAAGLERQRSEIEADERRHRKRGDRYGILLARGATAMQAARIEWLQEVSRELEPVTRDRRTTASRGGSRRRARS